MNQGNEKSPVTPEIAISEADLDNKEVFEIPDDPNRLESQETEKFEELREAANDVASKIVAKIVTIELAENQ